MIKKSTLLSCLLLCFAFLNNAVAQNLVPNPSFEVQDTCPAVSQINKAHPWVTATLGTPDLYNSTCGSQNLTARTGIGSAGIFVYEGFANSREYMEAPLDSALVAGKSYCVSFYVKRLTYRYASDRIGAYFQAGALNHTTTGVLTNVPQVDHAQHTILSGTSWLLVSGSFVASGGEDHIIIGNFHNDANTDTIVATSTSTSKVTYYAIDDISVTRCASGINENQLPNDFISVFPNPASEQINLQLTQATPVLSISILNAIGQEIEKISSPQDNNGAITLKTQKLEPGFYFLSVLTGQGRAIKKVTISK